MEWSPGSCPQRQPGTAPARSRCRSCTQLQGALWAQAPRRVRKTANTRKRAAAERFLPRKEGYRSPGSLLASGDEEGLGLTPRSKCVRETRYLQMSETVHVYLPLTRFVVVVAYLGKLAALLNLHRRDSLVQIVGIWVIRCISSNKWRNFFRNSSECYVGKRAAFFI